MVEYMDWLEFSLAITDNAFATTTINTPIPPAAFSKYQKAMAMVVHKVEVVFPQMGEAAADRQQCALTKLLKTAIPEINAPDVISLFKRTNSGATPLVPLDDKFVDNFYPPQLVTQQQVYFCAQMHTAGAAGATIYGRVGFTLREVAINQAWSATNNY